MKKIVINISDSTYEKLRLESIKEKKEISSILAERIVFKKFDEDIEESFSKFCDQSFTDLIRDL